MDSWLDSFGKWPPLNQLAFSAAVLAAGLLLVVLLLMAGYQAVYYLVVAVRGWPPKGKHDPTRPTWEEMKELNRHMEAYRKWDKEQRAKAEAAKPEPKPSPCTPCQPSNGRLFENPQPAEKT